MKSVYYPKGVCSRKIDIETENGIIKSVSFQGGCNGNLQGISRLIAGMPVEEAIKRLSGIRCGMKSTSCPDQLSRALREIEEKDEQ